MKLFTKSRFKVALECPTKLYYLDKPLYSNNKSEDEFLQSLAEGGFQVGELAKCYHPDGIDIVEGGYEIPLLKTKELFKNNKVTIFEAAFQYNQLFVRVDVCQKDGNTIELIEVKAKSFKGESDEFLNKSGFIQPEWRPYLYDIAFQKYVVKKTFPDYKVNAWLMLADKTKQASISGLNQKFQLIKGENDRTSVEIIGDVSTEALGEPILTKVNVDHIIDKIYEGVDSKEKREVSFEELVSSLATDFSNGTKTYHSIGGHCGHCEFRMAKEGEMSGLEECWESQTEMIKDDFKRPLVLDLWNYRGKHKCIEEGIYKLNEVEQEHIGEIKPKPDGTLSTRERQWLQVQKVKDNDRTEYLDKVGLRDCLSKHIYPLHFIDFETSMVAIPFYKGSAPYEQIAFQYSHHVLHKDGSIEHKSQFISVEKGEFPNFKFIQSLKKDLELDNGTIFRFAAHENTVLNQIKQQLLNKIDVEVEDREGLIAFIDHITHDKKEDRIGDRDMVDMRKIYMDYHYDPYTNGSNSIKAVLPAILNRSEFIQKKYRNAIYGKGCEIESLNFQAPVIWVQKSDDGTVISPYKQLPQIFDDLTQEEVDGFITDDEIAGGGAALTAFAKMQFTRMSEIERQHVIDGLLRYCELDTLAMVMIYEYWLNQIKK